MAGLMIGLAIAIVVAAIVVAAMAAMGAMGAMVAIAKLNSNPDLNEDSDGAPTMMADKPVYPTEDLRKAMLYVLYHHQGAHSPIGQPLRKALGIDPTAQLTTAQLNEVNQYLNTVPAEDFHAVLRMLIRRATWLDRLLAWKLKRHWLNAAKTILDPLHYYFTKD